jgi:hypothetical protein
MIFWSQWISLVERSRSSFALVISYVQVRIFLLFSMMPMRAINKRSKPTRVGLRTGTHMHRWSRQDILFQDEGNVHEC